MTPPPITANGRAIRRYRMLAGLGSGQFARKAGVSQSHLAHIEAGRRSGSPPVLKRIADALGLSVAEIVYDETVNAAPAADVR